jgi:hypothetical protein
VCLFILAGVGRNVEVPAWSLALLLMVVSVTMHFGVPQPSLSPDKGIHRRNLHSSVLLRGTLFCVGLVVLSGAGWSVEVPLWSAAPLVTFVSAIMHFGVTQPVPAPPPAPGEGIHWRNSNSSVLIRGTLFCVGLVVLSGVGWSVEVPLWLVALLMTFVSVTMHFGVVQPVPAPPPAPGERIYRRNSYSSLLIQGTLACLCVVFLSEVGWNVGAPVWSLALLVTFLSIVLHIGVTYSVPAPPSPPPGEGVHQRNSHSSLLIRGILICVYVAVLSGVCWNAVVPAWSLALLMMLVSVAMHFGARHLALSPGEGHRRNSHSSVLIRGTLLCEGLAVLSGVGWSVPVWSLALLMFFVSVTLHFAAHPAPSLPAAPGERIYRTDRRNLHSSLLIRGALFCVCFVVLSVFGGSGVGVSSLALLPVPGSVAMRHGVTHPPPPPPPPQPPPPQPPPPPGEDFVHEYVHDESDGRASKRARDEYIKILTLGPGPHTEHAVLYLLDTVVPVKIAKGYEGSPDAVLNLDNRRLFSWALLSDFWSQAENGPSGYRPYWDTRLRTWGNSGHTSSVKWRGIKSARPYFQRACMNFVILMGIKYETEILCQECNGEDGMTMDGTKLRIHSTRCNCEQPWRSDPNAPRDPTPERSEYLYITDSPRVVELVLLYTQRGNYNKRSGKHTSSGPGLTQDEYQELLLLCRQSADPKVQCLATLVEVSPIEDGEARRAPDKISAVLRSLAGDYPIAAIFANRVSFDSFCAAADLQQPFVLAPAVAHILLHAPVAAQLLRHATEGWTASVQPSASPLIAAVIAHGKARFHGGGPEDEERKVNDWYPNKSEYFLTGHFYKQPASFKLPSYGKDSGSRSNTACNKHSYKPGVASPGFFFVHCNKHCRLLGFHLMQFSESERTVHNLLYSRWEKPPSMVVYDNACNTDLFVTARSPAFYRDCQFILDRLHVKGHARCSPAYDPYMYQSKSMRSLNSQIAEQVNSEYKTKCSQLYAMSMPVFLFHIRHFIYLRVRRRELLAEGLIHACP